MSDERWCTARGIVAMLVGSVSPPLASASCSSPDLSLLAG
jgi:hypothetical protein